MKHLLSLLLCLAPLSATEPDTAKPWTRWWWLGSGVDEKNLTRQLESFAKAGIGGVEICPIYGAQGYEDRDLDFLSDEWIEMLDHTSKECARLGLGLDLTTGTGWPFGGPWVDAEHASHTLVPVRKDVAAGDVVLELPEGRLECLQAFAGSSDPVDLLPFVKDGELHWQAPAACRILGIVAKSPIQQVKRAAPGAEGSVVDPFSPQALEAYLARFDEPLAKLKAPQPRAHFHDSFEYYGANWTPGLVAEFGKRHGYDLADRLPAFFGEADDAENAEVAHDYRETLDALHRSYLETWNHWAKKHGSLTRNQAHGSPGNLLDHYAVADIPETEIFRHVEDPQIPMLQFAASAAHVTGKNLVSAESFTWLGEHFQVEPAALKTAADFLWLGGVNHIVFHGMPYTPEDAGWPGWLFYASTHMGENGGLWRDLPAFNDYIRTVQAGLQSGRPDTSVLLYWPVHELWAKPAKALPLLTLHNQHEWLHGTSFHDAAMSLWENGIPCDFVSDRLLEQASVRGGAIELGGLRFKTLVVPDLERLPEATAETLAELAAKGASLRFLGKVPSALRGRTEATDPASLIPALSGEGILPEPMSARGIRFVRRVDGKEHIWFLVNHGKEPLDAWIPLGVPFKSAVFTDPSRPDRSGAAEVRDGTIHLRLEPGESRLMRSSSEAADAPAWRDFPTGTDGEVIAGPWKIEFVEGGPDLPESAEMTSLESWTTLGDEARNFSGTARYTTTFTADAGWFVLDLGQVAETCRVTLNGQPLGSSFFPPHRFDLSEALKQGENTLEIEVTNLAANRIADLDRRGVEWKAFHEINFVNIDYEPFDASDWEPLPSGLLGPVRLLGFPTK